MKRLLCWLFGHRWHADYTFRADKYMFGEPGFTYHCERCGAMGSSTKFYEDIEVFP